MISAVLDSGVGAKLYFLPKRLLTGSGLDMVFIRLFALRQLYSLKEKGLFTEDYTTIRGLLLFY